MADQPGAPAPSVPSGRPSPGGPAPLSQALRDIQPFLAMEVLAEARRLEAQGRRIIHLEVGEPDFPTPEPVLEAGIKALRDGETGYTESGGLMELREAIAQHYGETYGVAVHPGRIIVTPSSSAAMVLAFSALLNPGDLALVADPYYPPYLAFIRQVGAQAVPVLSTMEEGLRCPPERLARHVDRTVRAIVVNSPANPTGAVLSPAEVETIANLGPALISDEIYHGIEYGGRAHSALEFTDRAFIINGFSKRYAMTGWRLGFCIVPPGFERAVLALQQNLFISASSFVQRAAIAALTQCAGHVEEMVRTYDRRRRFLLERLRGMGLRAAADPAGAFYLLVDTRPVDGDSYRLSFDLLEHAGIATTPGIDFGRGAEGCIRISYANSMENLEEAMDRLEQYLSRRLA